MLWFRANCSEHGFRLKTVYEAAGVSRQSVAQLAKRQVDNTEREAALLEQVRLLRKGDYAAVGCRKLYSIMQRDEHLSKLLYMGRRDFEQLLLRNELGSPLFKPKYKAKHVKQPRFSNALVDKAITGINQVWVSDTTYLLIWGTWQYLTTVIDYYSRRVLAAHLSKELSAEQTTISALQQAIVYRGGKVEAGCIFHSDGGSQYSDKGFLALIQQHGMVSSMSRMVYENTLCERFNGLFKQEYLALRPPANETQLQTLIRYSVWSFNQKRPHGALQNNTPIQFEQQQMALPQTERKIVKAWTLSNKEQENKENQSNTEQAVA